MSKQTIDFDASCPDGRDVQVRRTLTDIEQSIEAALGPLAVAPNNEATWAIAVTTVTSFLERRRLLGQQVRAETEHRLETLPYGSFFL